MMIATGTSTMYKATDPEKYNIRWDKACFLVLYQSMEYRFDFFSVGVWLESKNWFLKPTEKIETVFATKN